MNFPINGALTPPLHNKFSFRENVGKTLDRIYSAFIYIPLRLLNLILKIKHIAAKRLAPAPLIAPSPNSSQVSAKFQKTNTDQTKIKKGIGIDLLQPRPDALPKPPQSKSPEIKAIGDGTSEGNATSEIDSKTKSPEIKTIGDGTSEIDSKISVQTQSNELLVIAIAKEEEVEIVKVSPTIIDVPDDGNCLLYAMAIGLRKKYANNLEIQSKLQWEVDPQHLIGSLSKKADFLEAPGKKLREEAGDYLEKNQSNDDIMLALMEGIGSHLEVTQRKLNEEKSLIPILLTDIEILKKEVQTLSKINEFDTKMKHLKTVEESIEYQNQNMPNEDDLQGYIDITKKDRVYCGVAQLLALSKEYNVPTRVLYNFGTENQYEQIFNEEVNLDQNPPLPILTLAHVNGNHFQFLDD